MEQSEQTRTGAIYLNPHNQNHYNVVLSVDEEESILTQKQDDKVPNELKSRFRNRTRMRAIRKSSSQTQKTRYAEKRKECQRQRYQQDDEFREKKLKLSTERYLNDKNFQARVRQTNKEKYHHVMILSIRAKPKMKSIEQMKSIRKLSKRRV